MKNMIKRVVIYSGYGEGGHLPAGILQLFKPRQVVSTSTVELTALHAPLYVGCIQVPPGVP